MGLFGFGFGFGFKKQPLSKLDELKKVLDKDPASRQFLALAEEYKKVGKLKEAADTLEKGLRLNPSYVAGHVALGRLSQQIGRPEDAIKAYLAALKHDPQNLVAIRQLADAYLAKGEKVEAIKKLKLYRGLKPGERDVTELIQQLELELNPPKPAAVPPSSGGVRPPGSYLSRSGGYSTSGGALPPPPTFVSSVPLPPVPQPLRTSEIPRPPLPPAAPPAVPPALRTSEIPRPTLPPSQTFAPPLAPTAGVVGPAGPPTGPVPPPPLPPGLPRSAVPPLPPWTAGLPSPASVGPVTARSRSGEFAAPPALTGSLRDTEFAAPPALTGSLRDAAFAAPPPPPPPPIMPSAAPSGLRPEGRSQLLELTFDGRTKREPVPAAPPRPVESGPVLWPAPPPYVARPADVPGATTAPVSPPPPLPPPGGESVLRVAAPGPQTAPIVPPVGVPPAPPVIQARSEPSGSDLEFFGEPTPFDNASPALETPFGRVESAAPSALTGSLRDAEIAAGGSDAAPRAPGEAEFGRPSLDLGAPMEIAEPGPEERPVEPSEPFAVEPLDLSQGADSVEVSMGEGGEEPAPMEPLVTATLAELYRDQGQLTDARQALELLARSETDPERSRELREQVSSLPPAPAPERQLAMARLRDFLDRLPTRLALTPRPPEAVLESLVSISGIKGAALADRAGLSIAAAGDVDEVLVGELTALYNGIDRSRHEVGSGALGALALAGEDAGAMLSSLGNGYSLVLSTLPGAPVGRLRYESSRAADELRSALA